MYREQELRSIMNMKENCWKRINKDGTEYYNKEFYNSNYERIQDELLKDIEDIINK